MLVVWVGLKWLVLCEVLNSTNGQCYQYHTLNYEERMSQYISGSRTHSTTQSPPMQTFPGSCLYAVAYRNAWRLSGRLAPVRWPSGTTAQLQVPGSSAHRTHVISVHCPSRHSYICFQMSLTFKITQILHGNMTANVRVLSSGIQRRVVRWKSRKINRAKNSACCK